MRLILSKQVVKAPSPPTSVKLMRIVAARILNTTQRFQAVKVESKRIILVNYGAVPVDGGMAVSLQGGAFTPTLRPLNFTL